MLSIPVSSQTGTLTLYTKSDCNNCKYSKNMLHKNGIAFKECPLEESANATEMLKNLKSAGYSGPIYLPVIFENDTLVLHPVALNNDSTLYFVIQKIVAEKELYGSDSIRTEIIPPSNEEEGGDCVITIEDVDS